MTRRMFTVLTMTLGLVVVPSLAAIALPADSGDFPGGPDDGGSGIPGWFIALFILIGAIGVVSSIWRYSVVKKIGRNAGLSEGESTAMALLGGQGNVDTAILASTIHRHQTSASPASAPAAPMPSPSKPAEERLVELQGLKDRGVITAEEYETRRRAIINSI